MKSISKALIVFVFLLTGGFIACALCGGDPDPEPQHVPSEVEALPAFIEVRSAASSVRKPRRAVDPYRHARSWCGPPDWDTQCETDADCSGIVDPVGFEVYCRTPRWALLQHVDAKMCVPGRYGPDRKGHMRKRLRVYVDHVCEPPDWWREDYSCWRYDDDKAARRCLLKKYCDPDDLMDFLRVPAQREANWKPFAAHRLPQDVRANETAWAKYAKRYRWHIEMDGAGDVVEAYPTLPGFNRYYGDLHRWRGLGLYGQNTPLWITAWDMRAPPEAFCREVPSSEAYLRATRRNWLRIVRGVDCDGDGEREWSGSGVLGDGSFLPTWADLHQATSVGKLCPRATSHDLYAARASKVGLDPDEPVRLVRLGERIEPARQNLVAAWLQIRMDLIWKP